MENISTYPDIINKNGKNELVFSAGLPAHSEGSSYIVITPVQHLIYQ